jgi:hypothetical protein
MYVSLQSVQKNQQFFSRSVKDIKIEAKSFGIFWWNAMRPVSLRSRLKKWENKREFFTKIDVA